MQLAARAAAAIGILDKVLAGEPAEKVLTSWGRGARYAGSGDRAAVRDIVYDGLRCLRSFAALGGAPIGTLTGRSVVLGAARAAGVEALWFDGSPHGPAVATEPAAQPEGLDALDCPAWLTPQLQQALGEDFAPVMQALQSRAPVFLRVNAGKTTVEAAMAALAAEGITTRPHPLAQFALEVTGNARKIQNSATYAEGLVELQDAASQALAEAVPLRAGAKVLDLCAGGGGKSLALAARAKLKLYAHDANPRRMADLPARAARAGVKITLTTAPESQAPFDVVLADVPCSGSGSWRRDPEGKWSLSAERLAGLVALQSEILDRAARLCAPNGVVGYATCSLLRAENEDQVAAFLARTPGWSLRESYRFTPLQDGDGFGLALLARD
ncbi:RsmB/NOP family class I SAM-dependent RNA methyltransferase [Xinfangfangia sp. CPCC 101601]|uniref:RsmB/NOP family class I SAM-dependent RNA methyltransferase n=1 Tax=Pseudogemmobacter lacusdianii TaxID=3069608 RepID=A0ABU0VV43_9RHOB|nr:RsmB/NOP family class I SAM-dependent RNA methyltransferase [Xinfangfangia sp. CPCC 101601]MDQ2065553.1 RsmB/NOP family class I SAM-dependent RNA methyltransferase [Xinfangfangia sp. CPCC 101601]